MKKRFENNQRLEKLDWKIMEEDYLNSYRQPTLKVVLLWWTQAENCGIYLKNIFLSDDQWLRNDVADFNEG